MLQAAPASRFPLKGRTRLFAPAGAGKTTEEQAYALAQTQAGVGLDQITGISFTRVGAHTLANRVAGTGGGTTTGSALDGFRTLHSWCFRLLGLTRSAVLSETQIKQFFRDQVHLPYQSGWTNDGDADDYLPVQRTGSLGGALLSFFDWYRNRMLDLDTAFALYRPQRELRSSWSLQFVRAVAKHYAEYKASLGVFDFTDMLTETLAQKLAPPSRVLLVDEFQDCTALQIAIIDHWADQHDATLVAGDDDQTLFSFMGASPRDFLDFRADTFVLDTNYRCAQGIVDFSSTLIGRNRERMPKHVRAARPGGAVRHMPALPHAFDLSRKAFVLARTNYLLLPVAFQLEALGMPFAMRRGGLGIPLRAKHPAFVAFRASVALRAGRSVTAEQCAALFAFIRNSPSHFFTEHGSKKKLDQIANRERYLPQPETLISLADLPRFGGQPDLIDALVRDDPALLSRTDPDRLTYWRRLVHQHGDDILYTEPAITLSTIHGAKGLECDDCYLLPDVSARIAEGMYGAIADRESERRVFYVAATRARDNLFLLAPRGNLYNEEVMNIKTHAA